MELVNHPNHYNIEGKKECIVEMEELFGPMITAQWCYGNTYKYCYRAGLKKDNSIVQDIKKAKWYFDYAENLASKYKTPCFDLTMRKHAKEVLERKLKELKKEGISINE